MARNQASLSAAGVAVAILVGCNLMTDKATPTSPTSATLPPIAIPVILPPTPAPTPTPSPNPSPTPEPSPTPPPPTGGSCSLPPSNPPNPVCGKGSPSFLGDLESAITQVTKENPELFDFGDKVCEDCYRVTNVNRYITEVMERLSARGLCTLFDGEDLQIKNSNDFNDGYDIITANSYIRRGPGCYLGSCRPSGF
jgi:hypothetical protein